MASLSRRFDPESGLAFTESEARRTKIRAYWAWPEQSTFEKFKSTRNTKHGPRSLRETALRVIGAHMASLNAESFKHVPWNLARDIWFLLQAHKLDCFAFWRLLAQTYKDDTEAVSLLHRHENFSDITSCSDTEDYLALIRRLETPTTNWITCLTLRGVTCSRTALIELSELKSLSLLVIWSKEAKRPRELSSSSTDYRVDHKIVRAWSDAALEANAFPKLRILAIINQWHIAEQTFAHLKLLPSLYKTYVSGSDKREVLSQERFAQRYGWSVGGWMRWHGHEFQGNDWPGLLGVRSSIPGQAERARLDQKLPALRHKLQGPKYKSSVQVRTFQRQPISATVPVVLGKRKAPSTESIPRRVKASKIANFEAAQEFLKGTTHDRLPESAEDMA